MCTSSLLTHVVYRISGVSDQIEPVLSLPEKVLESLQTSDVECVVDEFQNALKIDKESLSQPDDNTKPWLRCLFRTALREKKLDVVKRLRQITPAGTTGVNQSIVYLPKYR